MLQENLGSLLDVGMRLLSIVVKELGNCSEIGGPREWRSSIVDGHSGYLAGGHFRVCESLMWFSGQV